MERVSPLPGLLSAPHARLPTLLPAMFLGDLGSLWGNSLS